MPTVMRFPSRRYAMRRDKLMIPKKFGKILPDYLLRAILTATEAAGDAFKFIRDLDSHYAQRFYRLCPVQDEERFTNHCISVRLLLGGAENDLNAAIPLPMPSKKAPAAALCLYLDEFAYKQYVREHENLKWLYLNHPFALWRRRAAELEHRIRYCGIIPPEKRMCLQWFHGYKREMQVWERKFHQLVLPSWEDMVNFLSETVTIVAAAGNPWDVMSR
jgi:hypothetical protein